MLQNIYIFISVFLWWVALSAFQDVHSKINNDNVLMACAQTCPKIICYLSLYMATLVPTNPVVYFE